jgi:hypothetical protein
MNNVYRLRMLLPYYFLFLLLTSCNKIETSETLSKDDIAYIQRLGLLEKDERIIQFYSEYKNSVAGNFFTDRKMVSYWIDERDTTKNHVSFANYKDIASIDAHYLSSALTYAPYMKVTKKDGSHFKICVEGEKAEIKVFFEKAVAMWKAHQVNK